MEQCRKKRSQSTRVPSSSKVTKTINRSSDDKPIAYDGPHRGSYQTANQKLTKLESDSRTRGRYKITEEHRIAFELGRRNSDLPAGALMKSLLADEMSKEAECPRQAPSLIAKLMGLDGMPSQHSAYKQTKRSSDGFHPKTVSAGSFRHRKACDNQSSRKIAREQPKFKDVYEVRECSRVRNSGCKTHMSPSVRHAEDEMAIATQNFMDTKSLSTDEKLRDSKEFHGETEVFDPNNYRFLKFLQEPDSLFAKHLHNLYGSQELHCEHVRNLKVSNSLESDSNINTVRHLTDRKASKKIDVSMTRECQGGLHHPVSRSQAKASKKSATCRAEANELACNVPTKIVLLKPNLEGSGKSAKFSSCSSSSCEIVSDGDTQENGGFRQADLWSNKRSPVTVDISAHKSQESKELAKEITRQMRNKLGEISFNVPLSGYRGYSADESSHELSGNDSSFESYAAFLTSHASARRSLHKKSSVACYTESSVNKEGKKRLSERWKMSHGSEKFRVGTKGSTLGEMLSISDKDVWLTNLDGERTQDRSSCSPSRNIKLPGVVEPFGISSKDGWRDGASGTERFLILKEGSRNGRKKGVNRDFSWQEGSSGGFIRLRDKKVNDAQGPQLIRKGKKCIVEGKNSSPIYRLDNTLTLDSETVRKPVKIPGCGGSGDDLMPTPEFSTSLPVQNDSSTRGLHETAQEPPKTCHIDSSPCSQYRGAQPESPANNREADQPSPVSVLDAPFVEDLSSGSECFERVSAELHGLRMQLRLLKLETGAYSAASMLVSGDEEEGSAGSSEEAKSSGSDIWEASYMADMLIQYKFNDNNPDIFIATWHSPECPVGPHVFEKLEKKYTRQLSSCSRSDRKLLFDQINSCILEIVERFTDPHPWVKPQFGTGMEPSWSNERFKVELCNLVEVAVKQEKEDGTGIGMALLQGNKEWMNLGNCIDDIGYDIGNMLLDELVSEALVM